MAVAKSITFTSAWYDRMDVIEYEDSKRQLSGFFGSNAEEYIVGTDAI